jgi:hypothetical protein
LLNTNYSLTSKHVTSTSAKNDLSYNNSKWLKHALPSGIGNFTDMDYEEETTSITEDDYTHTGFIQYLAIAWADEKGIVLRPDMFHHLICCEIAKNIIDNPKKYSALYTKSKDKKNIEIVMTGDEDKFIQLLDLKLGEEIIDKEFKKLMTDVKFISQPENYETVKRICFANSATPFYNYLRSKCGFPSITIVDVIEDWVNLYTFIVKMINIFEISCNYDPVNSYDLETESPITKTLRSCSIHIKEIIENFNNQTLLKKKLQSIFYVEDEHKCGSGHNFPYKIFGWIKNFYFSNGPMLKDYPTHLPYIPYKFNGVGNFAIVSGLISSKLCGNILEADYGNILLRINNHKLFDLIKK